MRHVKFFIINPADDDACEHIYSVVQSKKQAEEYINRLLYIENKTHFESWCALRGIESNPKSQDFIGSWFLYYNQCIATSPAKYVYRKMSYSLKDLIVLLRIYNQCVPIGCSFDDNLELITTLNYMSKLTKSDTDNILSTFNESSKNNKA